MTCSHTHTQGLACRGSFWASILTIYKGMVMTTGQLTLNWQFHFIIKDPNLFLNSTQGLALKSPAVSIKKKILWSAETLFCKNQSLPKVLALSSSQCDVRWAGVCDVMSDVSWHCDIFGHNTGQWGWYVNTRGRANVSRCHGTVTQPHSACDQIASGTLHPGWDQSQINAAIRNCPDIIVRTRT